MIGRILSLLFGFGAAVFLVTLAVANRHTVRIIGVILGGIATWVSQSRWRRLARSRGQDAARWRAEAERLTRERDASRTLRKPSPSASETRQLALAGH